MSRTGFTPPAPLVEQVELAATEVEMLRARLDALQRQLLAEGSVPQRTMQEVVELKAALAPYLDS